jgi:hypothetical protein
MISVHKFVRSLEVKVENLMGISAVLETRNQVARLTFTTEALCKEFIEKHGGVKNVEIEGKATKVIIRDSNIVERFVRITGIPYSLDEGIIKRRFREFGEVFETRWEKYHVAGDEFLYPVLSSWLIVRMSIERDIPSYVTIGEYRAIVRYQGQPPTCRTCDSRSHMGKDCPSSFRARRVVLTGPVGGNPIPPQATKISHVAETAPTSSETGPGVALEASPPPPPPPQPSSNPPEVEPDVIPETPPGPSQSSSYDIPAGQNVIITQESSPTPEFVIPDDFSMGDDVPVGEGDSVPSLSEERRRILQGRVEQTLNPSARPSKRPNVSKQRPPILSKSLPK